MQYKKILFMSSLRLKSSVKSAVCALTLFFSIGIPGASYAGSVTDKLNVQVNKPFYNTHKNKVEFIKELYNSYVFGSYDLALIADRFCTDRLRKKLADAYGYDCPDGEQCYAVWMFRSGVQDGPSNECRLTSIINLKNGWYRVRFIDMGVPGYVEIKFVNAGDSFKMDDVKNNAIY